MNSLWQDIRYSIRVLRLNPGFALTAILVVALGVGATTAIFSVVNAALFSALSYPDAERLVQFAQPRAFRDRVIRTKSFPLALVQDWESNAKSFEQFSVYTGSLENVFGAGDPSRLFVGYVDEKTLPLLGGVPVLGRGFTEQEMEGAPVALLDHGFWRSAFAGRSEVLGETIRVGEKTRTVIGVLPKGFSFPEAGVISVMPVLPAVYVSVEPTDSRRRYYVMARLKPGVAVEQARAEMRNYLRIEEFEEKVGKKAALYPVFPLEQQQVRGSIPSSLFMLLGAVGFVLLIACANVANLLLARAVGRRRELAVRAALGAGRLRLTRQLLTESLLLGLLGGAAGVLLAWWGANAMMALRPSTLTRLHEVTFDWPVLLFSLGAALLSSLLFGIVPLAQAFRPDIVESLKGSGHGSGGRRRNRLQGGLVVAEVGLAVVLLAGAGLMIRSFLQLSSTELGFNSKNLVGVVLRLPSEYREDAQKQEFYRLATEQLQSIPGIEDLTLASSLPLDGIRSLTKYEVPPGEAPDGFSLDQLREPSPFGDDVPRATGVTASPQYFRLLGVPLRAGRGFTAQDNKSAPPVAIISEHMARRIWGSESPIGRRLYFPRQEVTVTIVGVAADLRFGGLKTSIGATIYRPLAQSSVGRVVFVLRTPRPPGALRNVITERLLRLDSALQIPRVLSVEESYEAYLDQPRFYLLLFGVFGGLAVTLAAVGLFGVLAYSVAQRTQEIGIRMALGARPGDILRLVVGQGMLLAAIGVVLGLGGAFGLTRLMQSLLHEITPTDPVTFAVVAVMLLSVAALACTIPARRAMRVDPMVALRYE